MTTEPYDRGGMLPCYRMAVTISGKPERVLSPGESDEERQAA